MKRLFRLSIITMLITIMAVAPAFAYAANKLAVGWYSMAIYDLSSTGPVNYLYRDITGDGIYDAITESSTYMGGSGRTVTIFTFRNDKLTVMLEENIYMLSDVYVYKANHSLVLYAFGHGHSEYDYYKIVNGVYYKVAYRYRLDGGKWVYYNSYGKKISKEKFNSIVKKVMKGKKETISISEFKTSEMQS